MNHNDKKINLLEKRRKLTMNKSREIYSLIKQVTLVGITCIVLLLYFTLFHIIKSFCLPSGATILLQIAIVFAIFFTIIIAILGCIDEDQKIKETKQ